MKLKLTAVAFLALIFSGCNSENSDQDKKEIEHFKKEKTDIDGVEKIQINGSPTPPEGYDRPVVDEKEIEEKVGK